MPVSIARGSEITRFWKHGWEPARLCAPFTWLSPYGDIVGGYEDGLV